MSKLLVLLTIVIATFSLVESKFGFLGHVEPTKDFSIEFLSREFNLNNSKLNTLSSESTFHETLLNKGVVSPLTKNKSESLRSPYGDSIRVKFSAFDKAYDMLLPLDNRVIGSQSTLVIDDEVYYPQNNVYTNIYDSDNQGLYATFTVMDDLSVEGLIIVDGQVLSVSPISFITADIQDKIKRNEDILNVQSSLKSQRVASNDNVNLASVSDDLSELKTTLASLDSLGKSMVADYKKKDKSSPALRTLSSVSPSSQMVITRMSDFKVTNADGSPKFSCGTSNEMTGSSHLDEVTKLDVSSFLPDVLSPTVEFTQSPTEASFTTTDSDDVIIRKHTPLTRWLGCHQFSDDVNKAKIAYISLAPDLGASKFYSDSPIVNSSKVWARMTSLIAQSNMIFGPQLGLSLQIKDVFPTASSSVGLPLSSDNNPNYKIDSYLTSLASYFSQKLGSNNLPALVAGLTRNYVSGTVGLAYVGTFCKSSPFSVSSMTGNAHGLYTFIHELGHNLGGQHTFESQYCLKYIPGPNAPKSGDGIMGYGDAILDSTFALHPNDVGRYGFAYCHFAEICTILKNSFNFNNNKCFGSTTDITKSTCGNGVLEFDEECDSGADNACCKNCRFVQPHYTCQSPHPECCNNCVAKPFNTGCENGGRCSQTGTCEASLCAYSNTKVCPNSQNRFGTCEEACLFDGQGSRCLFGKPSFATNDGLCITSNNQQGYCAPNRVCVAHTYKWEVDDAKCECGVEGNINRVVRCLNSLGSPVGHGFCNPATKPEEKLECSIYSGCKFAWKCSPTNNPMEGQLCSGDIKDRTGFSQCVNNSGGTCGLGTVKRDVVCVSDKGEVSPDDKCIGTKPATSSPCSTCSLSWKCASLDGKNNGKCSSDDVTSHFSSCTADCNKGTALKTRKVECYNYSKETTAPAVECNHSSSNGYSQPKDSITCEADPFIDGFSSELKNRDISFKFCYFGPHKTAVVSLVDDDNKKYSISNVPLSNNVASTVKIPTDIGANSKLNLNVYISKQVSTSSQFSIPSLCKDVSCSNNGTCNEKNNQCTCPSPFSGNSCQESTCSLSQCIASNSKMTDNLPCTSPSSSTCDCKTGFVGHKCEKSLTCTNKDTCANGYHTTLSDGSCKCNCNINWSGAHCDRCNLSCVKNNGTPNSECTACNCKDGFVGKKCECSVLRGSVTFDKIPAPWSASSTDGKPVTRGEGTPEWLNLVKNLRYQVAKMSGIPAAEIDLYFSEKAGSRLIVTFMMNKCLLAVNNNSSSGGDTDYYSGWKKFADNLPYDSKDNEYSDSPVDKEFGVITQIGDLYVPKTTNSAFNNSALLGYLAIVAVVLGLVM